MNLLTFFANLVIKIMKQIQCLYVLCVVTGLLLCNSVIRLLRSKKSLIIYVDNFKKSNNTYLIHFVWIFFFWSPIFILWTNQTEFVANLTPNPYDKSLLLELMGLKISYLKMKKKKQWVNSYFLLWNFDWKSCFVVVFFLEWNEWKNPQFNFSSQILSIERNFFKWYGKETKILHLSTFLIFQRIWKREKFYFKRIIPVGRRRGFI